MTVAAIVVDNSIPVVGFTEKALKRLGYQVSAANDGEEAVMLCEEHRNRFQLVVADVFRSGRDHRAMIARMRHTQPGMKVLYTSGVSADVLHEYGVSLGEDELLEKPFTLQDLNQKLSKIHNS